MQNCYPDSVATAGLDIFAINSLNCWQYPRLPLKCKIYRNVNFIDGKLVVLTGEDIWSYLGGKAQIWVVPLKSGDAGSGILCPFTLCFLCALAV